MWIKNVHAHKFETFLYIQTIYSVFSVGLDHLSRKYWCWGSNSVSDYCFAVGLASEERGVTGVRHRRRKSWHLRRLLQQVTFSDWFSDVLLITLSSFVLLEVDIKHCQWVFLCFLPQASSNIELLSQENSLHFGLGPTCSPSVIWWDPRQN